MTDTTSKDYLVRMGLLEGEVSGIKNEVSEIKAGQAEALKAIRAIGAQYASQPKAANYRDIIGAVLSTFTVCALIGGFANWWGSGLVSQTNSNVARIERVLDAGEYAVVKYRLEQVERLLEKHGVSNVVASK